MSGIVKSDNTQGNQYHKGKGSPDGGQFASVNDSGASQEQSINNTRRSHIENPVYERFIDFLDNHDDEDTPNYDEVLDALQQEFNQEALKIIMQDTGYDQEHAQQLQNSFNDYFGGDYEDFTSGKRANDVAIIDEGLKKMPKFDGRIIRGTHFVFDDWRQKEAFRNLVNNLREGNEITIKNTPSSWTSDKATAMQFGREPWPNFNSMLFVCDNNKSGASVTHISHFGSGEAEVLIPSNTRYRVKKTLIYNKKSKDGKFLIPTKTVICYLEEI